MSLLQNGTVNKVKYLPDFNTLNLLFAYDYCPLCPTGMDFMLRHGGTGRGAL